MSNYNGCFLEYVTSKIIDCQNFFDTLNFLNKTDC